MHLISLSFKQVEAKFEGLRPLNIVMPADPHNQTEEWRHNMAAKVPSPNQFPSFKNGTKSEPGTKCFAKIIFRVPSFRLIFVDVSCNAVTVCRQNPSQTNYIRVQPVIAELHPQSHLSFCFTTVSPSLTKLTALLHQSHDCSCYVSRPILAHPPL